MAQVRSGCPARSLVDEFASLGVNVLYDGVGLCPGSFGPGLPTPAQDLDSGLSGRTPPIWFWDPSPRGQQQLAGAATLLDWQPAIVHVVDGSWMLDKCKGKSTAHYYSTISAKVKAGALVSAYVLVGSIPDSDTGSSFNCLTQQRMSVALWTALVAGASAIDYITIDPRNATVGNGFNVTPAAAGWAAALSGEVSKYGAATRLPNRRGEIWQRGCEGRSTPLWRSDLRLRREHAEHQRDELNHRLRHSAGSCHTAQGKRNTPCPQRSIPPYPQPVRGGR